MRDISMTTATEPDGAPRVAGLDILRGIAILGILFMNINDMGGSLFSSFDSVRHLGWSATDQIAWWLRQVFANGTARCMLEMLFGVGMVILTDRAARAIETSADSKTGWLHVAGRTLFGSGAVLRGYYWRNFVLFMFGLVHIFILMWPGDILHTYGLAAMVAFLFRRCGPKTLLGIGLILALLQLIGGGVSIYMSQSARTEIAQLRAKVATGTTLTAAEKKTLVARNKRDVERAKTKKQTAARIAHEDEQRSPATGNFITWISSAWAAILFIWGVDDGFGGAFMLEQFFVWEAAGTMLIGAALFKWGVIQGKRSRRFYLWAMLIAYAIGLGGRATEAYWTMQFDDFPHYIYATQEVTRLATTFGHIAAVWLLLGTAAGASLLKPFEAAGRTALSIYIAQTLICLWVLYPPFMLGLYGTMTWGPLMLTALAINAVLLVLANMWVKRFDIAPVEWAWRSIIEGRMLPWRKTRGLSGVGNARPLPA